MTSYSRLKRTCLFEGMEETEIQSILECLSAQRRQYDKGEVLFHAGDTSQRIGVVLSGSVHFTKEDYWGNRLLLSRIGEAEVFGEAYAGLHSGFAFDITAAEKTQILFLDLNRVLTSCPKACQFHQRLIRNLLTLLACKNMELTKKVDVLSQRTVRSKLMEYLSTQARLQRCVSFDIPFNRQQLADYLAVDRCSMTVELGKMQKEGILRFEKNHFTLL